ncbi:galactose-3-O-sulfotransferase-domain-containing protein [Cladochytrium replicatum]|nr:galactose-3-O-sulfotransferase-domain-containing protein [Cladochytrium replicatum]
MLQQTNDARRVSSEVDASSDSQMNAREKVLFESSEGATDDPRVESEELRQENGNPPVASWVRARPSYIFIKTHKTGSTTLGSIFFRYGVRHSLKIFQTPVHYAHQMDFEPEQLDSSNNRNSDIFLNHFIPKNDPLFENRTVEFTTENLIQMYRRGVPDGIAVTILREPHARFISHFAYLVSPSIPGIRLVDYAYDTGAFFSVGAFGWSLNRNRQCQELGIRTQEELERFLQYEKDRYFGMILITELFDESLVLMRRKFGWERQDILYVKMLDSCEDLHRWDNREVKCSREMMKEIMTDPEYETTRELIEEANKLDIILYSAVKAELQKKLEEQGEDFWEEVAELKMNVAELQENCRGFSSLNSAEQIALMEWTDKITRSSYFRQLSNLELREASNERRKHIADSTSFDAARDTSWDQTDGNGADQLSWNADSSSNEMPEFSDLLNRLEEMSTDNDVGRLGRRGLTIEVQNLDPYPCFPYSITDMHYEHLVRLGGGQVSYIPGLVPTSQDEFWREYSQLH